MVNDICYVTDYSNSNKVSSAAIQVFNPVVITNPSGTTPSTPRNICVTQTLAMTGTGGLGTNTWTLNPSSGAGSTAPATGNSSTYTAPAVAVSLTVTLTDPVTSMTSVAYLNVTNLISMSPASAVTVAISPNPIHYPGVTTGVSTTTRANLAFNANCGLQPYTVTPSASVGGSGFLNNPAGMVNNNIDKYYTPATTSGTTNVTFTDMLLSSAVVPVYDVQPTDIKSSWGFHTCVMYSHPTFSGNNKLKCWGYNASGQLGYGDNSVRGDSAIELGFGLLFVKDTGTSGSDMLVKKVAVGMYHTCALLSNDQVKCWGENGYGQLGYDDTTDSTSPRITTVNLGAGTPTDIYAFGFNSCAKFSDNRVKCWGRNNAGQLGQNNTINYGSNSTTAAMSGLNYISVGGSNLLINKIVGTQLQTCALTTTATVYCWGYGNGAESTSTTVPPTTPNLTTIPTDYNGELGYGTTNVNFGDGGGGSIAMSALPQVPISLTAPEIIIEIQAGRSHVCVIIGATLLSTSGTPLCWGWNRRGQLGIDNTTAQGRSGTGGTLLTSRASTITNAVSLSLGSQTTCAIRTTGDALCWGYTRRGQALNASTTRCTGANTATGECSSNIAMSAAVNALLGTSRTALKLVTGYDFACAILDNYGIKCWGLNSCGNGTGTNYGCLMNGYATLVNTSPAVAAPNMMSGRYIGDGAAETGDNLPYVNH